LHSKSSHTRSQLGQIWNNRSESRWARHALRTNLLQQFKRYRHHSISHLPRYSRYMCSSGRPS